MANALGLNDTNTPILHGLCTFGIAVRAILQHVGNDTEVSFLRMEGRFTKPVFLSDALTVKLWETVDTVPATNDGAKLRTIAFVVMNKTRGDTVIDSGSVQLQTINNNAATQEGMNSKL